MPLNAVTPERRKNKRLVKVVSTKLPIEVYNLLLLLAQEQYKRGLLNEPAPSELLRLTIFIMFEFIRKMPKYDDNLSTIMHLNHSQQHEELPPRVRALISSSLSDV